MAVAAVGQQCAGVSPGVTLPRGRVMLQPMPVAGADRSSIQTSGAGIRVLLVADYDIFDRFGRMVRQVAIALQRDGLRVSLLTDDPVAMADFADTPVECHWLRFLSGWLAQLRVGRFLDRLQQKPDLIHIWGATCLDTVGPWASRAGVPVMVHVLSAADAQRVLRPHWRGPVRVLAGDDSLHRMLSGARAPEMPEPADFSPAFTVPAAAAQSADDGRVLGVLWTGRLVTEAGLELLVDAVASLDADSCAMQLALIGLGPLAGAVRRRIRQAGVSDRISLIEEPDLWEPAISGVDVCVVPACQDEISLAPLLAMALGKVVIASRDQRVKWFIEDQTCWQFTPGSPTELAQCLQKAAGRPHLADELRRSARAYAEMHHCLGRLVSELQHAYAAFVSTAAATGTR
jgi:glycosyltransferase involved in cell wall biosynthesis